MNLMKKTLILGFLILLNLVEPSKANPTIGLEFGLALNLTPHVSLYYKPVENPYDLAYEIKYTSYYAVGVSTYVAPAYSLGFGIKKYMGNYFSNIGLLLFMFEYSKSNPNALQIGAEIGIGEDSLWSNTFNTSTRLSLGYSTDFRGGWGFMINPELGVGFKI